MNYHYNREKEAGGQQLAFKDNYYKLLCEREALKMQFLAQKSPVAAFVKNSLQLWYAAQWDKNDPSRIFYGYGLPQFAIMRQIERKRSLEGAREAEKTGKLSVFTEPFESMVQNIIRIGEELQDYYECETPYEALREFHTPGFANPFSASHIHALAKAVGDRQGQAHVDVPNIPQTTHDIIIGKMLELAEIDLHHNVELMNVEAPACLGYPESGIEKGVKLGLTYNADNPLKSLLNNWHEIGHACYRQFMPAGYMVAGRAMDESIAFMFEYHIGYSDEFLAFLLENGLEECGYDKAMLKAAFTTVDKNTKRIETNPLRHPVDIFVHSRFEEILVNEENVGQPPEAVFANVIEPFKNIFPDDYSFFQDAHTRGGIFGDREAYNAGYAGAFQIGTLMNVTLDNMVDTVKIIAKSRSEYFAPAIHRWTGKPLSIHYYMNWISETFDVPAFTPSTPHRENTFVIS